MGSSRLLLFISSPLLWSSYSLLFITSLSFLYPLGQRPAVLLSCLVGLWGSLSLTVFQLLCSVRPASSGALRPWQHGCLGPLPVEPASVSSPSSASCLLSPHAGIYLILLTTACSRTFPKVVCRAFQHRGGRAWSGGVTGIREDRRQSWEGPHCPLVLWFLLCGRGNWEDVQQTDVQLSPTPRH